MPHPLAEHLAEVLMSPDERNLRDARLVAEALTQAGREARRTGRPVTVEGVRVSGCAIIVDPSK